MISLMFTSRVKVHCPGPSQGGGGSDPPPQLPIRKILFHPLVILFHPWNVDDVTRAMSKGGGVLVNAQEGGVFQFVGGADDVTRTMSKGGGACECPRVGAFFKLMTSRGQCPRGGGAPPPIQVQAPPPAPPHLAGWLRACCHCPEPIHVCCLALIQP